MSVEKNTNARIQHKHDIEANWNKATNFIPKAGELVVYDADENYTYARIKIGDGVTTVNNLSFIDETKADKTEIPTLTSQLENDSHFMSENQVKALVESLNSDMTLRFYCIEDVTIVTNGVSKVYPANSNVEVKFLETDIWEIIPTSNNSILALNGFPGALGTYYPWLEGVKQFSNILFDMNNVDFYSKWSQGNQGAYQVQFAQYVNCVFWSDNPYVKDVSKRTNYTLYYTSQLPLCYSSIPDNTFKAFFLAFGVNSDPNWGNKAYRDSFAKATWATQAFSYYGARTIGIFGHDDPDFNITLPPDCRGLMYASTAVENAGTFDAINVTNFGAKSGSWRDAFGFCTSLRHLYIKNLKVNLNISWSPINYDSITSIISAAANEKTITISVSPYTYNLLGPSDFELAASKNITIELISTNYIEDRRLGEIANKADKNYVDNKISDLVNSAPETLDTLGELATAFNENKDIVDILNESIVNKQNKNVIVYRDSETGKASMTAPEIMAKVRAGENVYYTVNLSGGTLHPYLEGADTGVSFYSNYIDNDRVVGTGILISADGTITQEAYQLDHLKDTIIHITSPERNRWNDTYTKTETDSLLAAKANVQSDWNQNDEVAPDYIENRPFYSEESLCENLLVDNVELTFETSDPLLNVFSIDIKNGVTYNVAFDGTKYECVAYIAQGPNSPSIGNGAIGGAGGGNGEPFFITVYNGSVMVFVAELGTHTISISNIENGEIIHHLDSKYIKDMYREYFTEKVFIDNKTLDFSSENYQNLAKSDIFLSEKNTYDVIFDGVTYKDLECISYYSTFVGDEYFGNYPFCVKDRGDSFEISVQDNMSHTISLIERVTHIVTIDRKYVEGIAGENVTGRTFTIDDENVTAYDNAEIFNDYENNIATGSYSHAEGYCTVATGRGSHAEGHGAEAEGENAHAEGRNTSAIGKYSHAEGLATWALGSSAHAEGDGTQALEYSSHAEGIDTVADYCSHAEGLGGDIVGGVTGGTGDIKLSGSAGSRVYTTNYDTSNIMAGHYVKYNGNLCKVTNVDGSTITLDKTLSNDNDLSDNWCSLYLTGIAVNISHSEGNKTMAIGRASHSEGSGTIARGDEQHVQGRYNLEDESSTYSHIVGNGNLKWTGTSTYKITRSNAHTLDWDGNAWFAGDVYVGSTSGTNKDDGSKKLATEEFVTQKVAEINVEAPTEYDAIILKSSTSGSTKKFRLTIDDDGVLSAEEVIE